MTSHIEYVTGTEHTMSMFSATRFAARSGRRPGRTGDYSVVPAGSQADQELPLPRHILVALSAITADVNSIRQLHGDAPQLHAPLDSIVGKLDGLVHSIYSRAADTTANHSAAARRSMSDLVGPAPGG